MKIHKALARITKLKEPELKHMIQLCEAEIKNYDDMIRNYPTDRMERYSVAHRAKLHDQKKSFVTELNSRK